MSFQLGPIASGAGPHKSKRHVRVACTAVWLRRRLRHVLSWQSVQLATNAFPRGQTDQAGQLRSPLRTRLLPLSLSPFRPLLHLSPARAAYRALPLLSLSPPLPPFPRLFLFTSTLHTFPRCFVKITHAGATTFLRGALAV